MVHERNSTSVKTPYSTFPSGADWFGRHADCPLHQPASDILRKNKNKKRVAQVLNVDCQQETLWSKLGKRKIILNSLYSQQALARCRICFLRWIWTASNQSYLPEKRDLIHSSPVKNSCWVKGTLWRFLCTQTLFFSSHLTFRRRNKHCAYP